jgi:hypothetical protein
VVQNQRVTSTPFNGRISETGKVKAGFRSPPDLTGMTIIILMWYAKYSRRRIYLRSGFWCPFQ